MVKFAVKFVVFWVSFALSAWIISLLAAPTLHVSLSYARSFGIAYLIYTVGTLLNLDKTLKELE